MSSMQRQWEKTKIETEKDGPTGALLERTWG
jgi:hypothetical protein